MKKGLLKILLTAVVVIVLANILPGVTVASYVTAIIVAIVIALLNMIVRPLLVFFTLPVTVLTFGLFLFVINAIIILLAGKLITGFKVDGFLTAFLFSVLLSVFRSLLSSLIKEDES